jgi:endogenous inhibitor of DNA gyrase (YacG/DUF329 family)
MTTVVECPTCSAKVEWKENKFRPFCSERCKKDRPRRLGRGKYAIPAAPPKDAHDEE